MQEIVKLLVLAVIAVTPMWILAAELDQDEFVKSGAGIAMVAAFAAAMKLMESQIKRRNNNENH